MATKALEDAEAAKTELAGTLQEEVNKRRDSEERANSKFRYLMRETTKIEEAS